MNKRSLLIGGSSNIGRVLKTNILNIDYTYFKNKIENGIYFDISKRNLNEIVNLNKYSNIIILSAITKLDECVENKELSNNINIDSTKELINMISKKNIHIIFFSTEFVFDGHKGNYSEIDNTNPINLYGKQKLEIEKYIKTVSSKYTILRIAKTYSISFNDETLLSKWYKMLFKDNIKSIDCFSDQVFSPLFVEDLVLIINKIIDKKIYGTFNIGGPEQLSRKDCLEIILKTFNYSKNININETKLSKIKSKEKWPINVSFDISKLNNLLGIRLTKLSEACIKMKNLHNEQN